MEVKYVVIVILAIFHILLGIVLGVVFGFIMPKKKNTDKTDTTSEIANHVFNNPPDEINWAEPHIDYLLGTDSAWNFDNNKWKILPDESNTTKLKYALADATGDFVVPVGTNRKIAITFEIEEVEGVKKLMLNVNPPGDDGISSPAYFRIKGITKPAKDVVQVNDRIELMHANNYSLGNIIVKPDLFECCTIISVDNLN